MVNALTVDVEEYFHATEVQSMAREDQWDSFPSRIGDQVRKTLDIFQTRGIKGTFFILGWLAERCPDLIRKIAENGHEIGCHSYAHRLVYNLSPREFRTDTRRAVEAIRDACGVVPRIYRAPSYSITQNSLWALDVLAELGFTHDSSIFPITHDRYGIPGADRHAHVIQTASGPICEVPAATVELSAGQVLPIGGGGYLRLLPYRYTSAGIRRVNHGENKPVCIYFHPWELDPKLPRLRLSFISRLRTYSGLPGMQDKLERLTSEFSFSTISAAYSGRSEWQLPEFAAAART
jgi:polysaccharide deacetylase family protein (PEP-CTERM system associated)